MGTSGRCRNPDSKCSTTIYFALQNKWATPCRRPIVGFYFSNLDLRPQYILGLQAFGATLHLELHLRAFF
jgi:hypothetical protein